MKTPFIEICRIHSKNNPRPIRGAKLFVLFILFFHMLADLAFCAEKIAILYPEVTGSYQTVFQTILYGISAQKGAEYSFYLLSPEYDIDLIKQKLEADKTTAVITLGKRGQAAATMLSAKYPVVAGGLLSVPDGISGISLAADPELLFPRLKSLVPDCKNVFVVYSPEANGWLIPLAEAAAKKNGLKLNAFAADDLATAVQHYQQQLHAVRGPENAIWFSQLSINFSTIY